jgi:hypothetical protein
MKEMAISQGFAESVSWNNFGTLRVKNREIKGNNVIC